MGSKRRKAYVDSISHYGFGFSQISKQTKETQRNKCSQTNRLENPEELEPKHNHEQVLFLTVLLFFALLSG
jgi:hypothetical protein